jgi:hypothetical protein
MKESVEKVSREERRQFVGQLYPGCGTAELAARFGVSNVTIRNDLKALKIPIEKRGLTIGQKRHAVRMRREGRTLRYICSRLGCNYGTLRRFLEGRADSRPSNRDFGPSGELAAGRLTLGRAAKRFGLAQTTLRGAFDAGSVRGERIEGVGTQGTIYLFDETELAEDIAEAGACAYAGCDRPALGGSGGCETHGHALEQQGKPLSTEHRANVSQARRRYFESANGRAYLAQVRTPPVNYKCTLCRGRFTRSAKTVREQAAKGARPTCATCSPLRASCLSRARAALEAGDLGNPFARETAEAFRRAVAIGAEFESQILSRRPRTRGHPKELGIALVIEAAYVQGFTRKAIRHLLAVVADRHVAEEYVPTMLKRNGVRRRRAA